MPLDRGSKAVQSLWACPTREFSQAPFWFWNDELSEAEIARQMADFHRHGVYGFVIHPRVGLPGSLGWMSERLLGMMHFAIREAARNDMFVILYDEGMYPSGSSGGQVVEENPAFRPHGLFAVDLDEAEPGVINGFFIDENRRLRLREGQQFVAQVRRRSNGHRIAVVDRFISPGYSLIRGLHYLEEEPSREKGAPAEEMPLLADILNPEAVDCFIRLVYQRYFEEFGAYFGKTIKAIFTDEPSFFGKNPEPGAVPGNAQWVSELSPQWKELPEQLAALWYDDEPDAEIVRSRWRRALKNKLNETFYRPISKWCDEHGIELTGHPADPDDIGHLRWFHIPGQDIVWRQIEPGKPSALEGPASTLAKCASSAMIHSKRRRNANEFCGAYGHELTFDEMKRLAWWLLVRGCNLLIPHAFYYSIRGPRIYERPPDVGPNSPWWDEYKPFADFTRRLCSLNTDSTHVCKVAVMGLSDHLPWRAAKALFQHQIDFNYLEARHLIEDAEITPQGIRLADMFYELLIVEMEPPEDAAVPLSRLVEYGRLLRFSPDDDEQRLLAEVVRRVQADLPLDPAQPDVRVRHVRKAGIDFYMLFNEGGQELLFSARPLVKGRLFECLPDGRVVEASLIDIRLKAFDLKVFAAA